MGIFVAELDAFEGEVRSILAKRRITKNVDDLVGQIIQAAKTYYRFRCILKRKNPIEFNHIVIGDTLTINWTADFTVMDGRENEITQEDS